MSAPQATTLFRPVGPKELELIAATEFRAFPSRLPDQPIFYPVLEREYARQIARDWNSKDAAAGFLGFVLQFKVLDAFLRRYRVQTVGAAVHREYWIPAEDLQEFNENIVGQIEIVDRFESGQPTS